MNYHIVRDLKNKENADLVSKSWKIFVDSFPDFEQRSYSDHLLVMQESQFQPRIYMTDSDQVGGLLFYWDFAQVRYVEYLAINPAVRSSGLGTKLLQDFIQEEDKTLILEIDPIVDELSQKRWNFYQRLGFQMNEGIHRHPAYQAHFSSHDLIILSHAKILSAEERSNFVFDLENIAMRKR